MRRRGTHFERNMEGVGDKGGDDASVGAEDVDVQLPFPFPPVIPTPMSPSAPQDAPAAPAMPLGNSHPGSAPSAVSAAAALMQRHGSGGARQRPKAGGALQHFNGNSVLCCKGNCVLGPASSYKTVTATVTLITIPAVRPGVRVAGREHIYTGAHAGAVKTSIRTPARSFGAHSQAQTIRHAHRHTDKRPPRPIMCSLLSQRTSSLTCPPAHWPSSPPPGGLFGGAGRQLMESRLQCRYEEERAQDGQSEEKRAGGRKRGGGGGAY